MAGKRVISFRPEGMSRVEIKQANAILAKLTQSVKEEKAAVVLLPSIPATSGGEKFFEDGRNYWNPFTVRQPEHQATSFTLAATYPFLAGPPVPAAGPVIGLDLRSGGEFAFDPWEWYSRGWVGSANVLVAGGYRQGKSFFVKMLVTRCILFGRQGICTSDPKGEHARIAIAVGGDVIKLGSTASCCALDRGPRRADVSDLEYEASIASRRSSTLAAMTEMLLPPGHGLMVEEHTALAWALEEEIVATDDWPTVGGIYRRFANLAATETGGTIYPELYKDSRRLRHALRRLVHGDLAGLFDGPSTVILNTASPYTVFDTSAMLALGGVALGLSQLVTNSWVNSVIADKTSGRKYFVLAEEGWAEMNSIAALRAMQIRQKLSGEYGICTVMVVHEGGDFKSVGREGSEERQLAETLVNGFANKITFRQEPGQLVATASVFGFTPEDIEDVKSLSKGEALFKVKDRSYLLSTVAVSSDWERTLFDTDNAMSVENTPEIGFDSNDHRQPNALQLLEAEQNQVGYTEVCAACLSIDQHLTFCTTHTTRLFTTRMELS